MGGGQFKMASADIRTLENNDFVLIKKECNTCCGFSATGRGERSVTLFLFKHMFFHTFVLSCCGSI